MGHLQYIQSWLGSSLGFVIKPRSNLSKRSVVSCLLRTSISVCSWDTFPRSWVTSLAWPALQINTFGDLGRKGKNIFITSLYCFETALEWIKTSSFDWCLFVPYAAISDRHGNCTFRLGNTIEKLLVVGGKQHWMDSLCTLKEDTVLCVCQWHMLHTVQTPRKQ